MTTRRDFSFMGGFLFAGMVIALIAGLGAVFLQMPALGLAVAAMVAKPTTCWPPWGITSRSSTCSRAC
ncbi:MAG: hypothetical protein Q8K45_22070 [Rubrivivax sp.]|nr:hypothetical protein [Rubrivivax sp.]